MVNDFDRAILEKLKKVWPNTQYANTVIAYYTAYDATNDPNSKLQFPMINIYRPEGYRQTPDQMMASRFAGMWQTLTEEGKPDINYMIRFLVVNLEYQIDVFASSDEMLDEVLEDLQHMLSLDPTLEVRQTDKSGKLYFDEAYMLQYITGPVPNSEFGDGQRLYRSSIAYGISNARLANFRLVDLVDDVDLDVNIINNEVEPSTKTNIDTFEGET